MSLSKKNTNKLKSYLKNKKALLPDFQNDIFYSIIDNEIDINEKNTMKEILRNNQSKSISQKTNFKDSDKIDNTFDLSEEDLLYDEFDDLLDE